MNIESLRRAYIQFKMLAERNGWKKAEFLKKKGIFQYRRAERRKTTGSRKICRKTERK